MWLQSKNLNDWAAVSLYTRMTGRSSLPWSLARFLTIQRWTLNMTDWMGAKDKHDGNNSLSVKKRKYNTVTESVRKRKLTTYYIIILYGLGTDDFSVFVSIFCLHRKLIWDMNQMVNMTRRRVGAIQMVLSQELYTNIQLNMFETFNIKLNFPKCSKKCFEIYYTTYTM